ncbi:MAG: type II secretion system protein [Candidatus Saccharimonadales bacterium]
MRRGFNAHGFTIVEVMIVLAVTGLLIAGSVQILSGQQKFTEFYQTARDTQSQIDEVLSNTQNGYYSSFQNFDCSFSLGGPNIVAGSNPRGTNHECISMGRAIQMAPAGRANSYNVYNIIGLQYTNASNDTLSTTFAQAKPIALSNYSGGSYPLAADTTEIHDLEYGLGAKSMTYSAPNPITPSITDTFNTGVVAFISSLGSYGTSGLNSGNQQVGLYAYKTVSLGASKDTAVQEINSRTSTFTTPVYQVDICFDNDGGRNAKITIGSNGRQLSTDLKIGSGNCP